MASILLPESSLSASSVSTAVSVASSESSSVKSVLSLSISSFDSRSLSSSFEILAKSFKLLARTRWLVNEMQRSTTKSAQLVYLNCIFLTLPLLVSSSKEERAVKEISLAKNVPYSLNY